MRLGGLKVNVRTHVVRNQDSDECFPQVMRLDALAGRCHLAIRIAAPAFLQCLFQGGQRDHLPGDLDEALLAALEIEIVPFEEPKIARVVPVIMPIVFDERDFVRCPFQVSPHHTRASCDDEASFPGLALDVFPVLIRLHNRDLRLRLRPHDRPDADVRLPGDIARQHGRGLRDSVALDDPVLDVELLHRPFRDALRELLGPGHAQP
mmetsp:Transcript_2165/g.4930  ORF Transcript_2165/g.4930 Transcript_2165/m.4930 type:complete len:207 (-) Transcript_2165:1283-1903(-)